MENISSFPFSVFRLSSWYALAIWFMLLYRMCNIIMQCSFCSFVFVDIIQRKIQKSTHNELGIRQTQTKEKRTLPVDLTRFTWLYVLSYVFSLFISVDILNYVEKFGLELECLKAYFSFKREDWRTLRFLGWWFGLAWHGVACLKLTS